MRRERTILACVAAVWLILLVAASILLYGWIREHNEEKAAVEAARQAEWSQRIQGYLAQEQATAPQAHDGSESPHPLIPGGSLRLGRDDVSGAERSPQVPLFPDPQDAPVPLAGPLPPMTRA